MNKQLCIVTLKEEDIHQLKEAIEDLYYFEFVIGKKRSCCLPFSDSHS